MTTPDSVPPLLAADVRPVSFWPRRRPKLLWLAAPLWFAVLVALSRLAPPEHCTDSHPCTPSLARSLFGAVLVVVLVMPVVAHRASRFRCSPPSRSSRPRKTA